MHQPLYVRPALLAVMFLSVGCLLFCSYGVRWSDGTIRSVLQYSFLAAKRHLIPRLSHGLQNDGYNWTAACTVNLIVFIKFCRTRLESCST